MLDTLPQQVPQHFIWSCRGACLKNCRGNWCSQTVVGAVGMCTIPACLRGGFSELAHSGGGRGWQPAQEFGKHKVEGFTTMLQKLLGQLSSCCGNNTDAYYLEIGKHLDTHSEKKKKISAFYNYFLILYSLNFPCKIIAKTCVKLLTIATSLCHLLHKWSSIEI